QAQPGARLEPSDLGQKFVGFFPGAYGEVKLGPVVFETIEQCLNVACPCELQLLSLVAGNVTDQMDEVELSLQKLFQAATTGGGSIDPPRDNQSRFCDVPIEAERFQQ